MSVTRRFTLMGGPTMCGMGRHLIDRLLSGWLSAMTPPATMQASKKRHTRIRDLSSMAAGCGLVTRGRGTACSMGLRDKSSLVNLSADYVVQRQDDARQARGLVPPRCFPKKKARARARVQKKTHCCEMLAQPSGPDRLSQPMDELTGSCRDRGAAAGAGSAHNQVVACDSLFSHDESVQCVR
jgi:hypothetical protein